MNKMRQIILALTVALLLSTAPLFSQTLTIGADFSGVPDTNTSSPGSASTVIDLSSPATATGLVTSVHAYWSQAGCTNALKIKFFRPRTNLAMVAERGPFTVSTRDFTVTLSPPVSVQKGDVIGVTRLTTCGTSTAFHEQDSSYATFSGDYSGPYEAGYNAVFGARLALRGVGIVPTPPTANFTLAPLSPIAGQSVAFTDISTGSPTAWEWAFGDGSTSTARSPTHTYGSAGAYTVSLRASNTSGANAVTKTVTVSSAATNPQISTFSANPPTIQAGQSATLSWSTTNAAAVSISGAGAALPANGSVPVSPSATTTYSLVATGAGGTASATTTVTVEAGEAPGTLNRLRFAFTNVRRRAVSSLAADREVIMLARRSPYERFTLPVTASINDAPFTEIDVVDGVLTLSGVPGALSLEDWLPRGGSAQVSITNGDQNHFGVTLDRSSTEISVAALSTSILVGDVPLPADPSKTTPVRIEILQPSGGAKIDVTKTTWIVIHGRLNSAGTREIQAIAQAIKQKNHDHQVLLLDWESAARETFFWGGFSKGEQWIEPIGQWAARRLEDYGFSGQTLNLIGHSWGSYIADELAEEIGRVNLIVGLDPAIDTVGSKYNPNDTIDFGAHSAFSIAFHSSNLAGSATTPTTATEAFSVGFLQQSGGENELNRHGWIRDLFTSMILGNGEVSRLFTLDRLLEGRSGPWQTNRYRANEAYGAGPHFDGPYESVITSGLADRSPRDIRYFARDGHEVSLREHPLSLSAVVTPVANQTVVPALTVVPVVFTITVVDDSNLPIRGATVSGHDYLKDEGFVTDPTDANGKTSHSMSVPFATGAGTYGITFTASLQGSVSAQVTRYVKVVTAPFALNIASVAPSATQTLSAGLSATYKLIVVGGNDTPLSGVEVTGFDALKNQAVFAPLTDADGVTNYTTTVPAGATAGAYSITFNASRAGYLSSSQVTRSVLVTESGTATLSISSVSLDPPTAIAGVRYETRQPLAATGGTIPYTWSATGLPNGVSMNASSGALSGTPGTSGSFTVVVSVRDSSIPQKTASKNFPFTVATATQPLSITSTAFDPPSATVGVGYGANTSLAATGGTTPYTWSATGLPNGMQMDANSTLFGTPTASGSFTVTVAVKDSSTPQKSASKNLTLTVAAA
ncbi:MAG TPA: PKD domain-containing protein, partial [Thermoanaerobaculia bacterium]|nr:PKD domain-containing protein [Thermoanaerobaculia bacterium]